MSDYSPFSPFAQIAYDTYSNTRGRGGDLNDGPAWDAVAVAVIAAHKESLMDHNQESKPVWHDPKWLKPKGSPKGFFKVEVPPEPMGPPVILRRATEDEILASRRKFVAALREEYSRIIGSSDDVDSAWLAVAKRAEAEFAPDDPLPPTCVSIQF